MPSSCTLYVINTEIDKRRTLDSDDSDVDMSGDETPPSPVSEDDAPVDEGENLHVVWCL
jgi:hypothetical protein